MNKLALLLLIALSSTSTSARSAAKYARPATESQVQQLFETLNDESKKNVEKIEKWFSCFTPEERTAILSAIKKSKSAPSSCNRYLTSLAASVALGITSVVSLKSVHKNRRDIILELGTHSGALRIKKADAWLASSATSLTLFFVVCPYYWIKAKYKNHSKENELFLHKKMQSELFSESFNAEYVDHSNIFSGYNYQLRHFIVEIFTACIQSALTSKNAALNKPIHILFQKWANEPKSHGKRKLIIEYVLSENK